MKALTAILTLVLLYSSTSNAGNEYESLQIVDPYAEMLKETELSREIAAAQTTTFERVVKKRSNFSFRRITFISGPTMTEFQGQAVDSDQKVAPMFNMGFHTGAFADIGGRNWVLETGLSYKRVGSKYEGYTTSLNNNVTEDVSGAILLDYISIHAGGKYIIPASRIFKPYIKLSLVGAFLTQASMDYNVGNRQITGNPDGVAKNELGAMGGFGGSFYVSRTISLAPDIAYYRGITKASQSGVETYNAGWHFGVLLGVEL